MLDLLKKCFPRERGHGWCIQKFHAMTKMTYYMLKFGKARSFTGQVGERALKSIVKNHAEQTQRRSSSFTEQVAMRRYEAKVLECCYEDIKPTLGIDCVMCEQATDGITCKGRYQMQFHCIDSFCRGDIMRWHDKRKNRIGINVHNSYNLAIHSFARKHDWRGKFEIKGFTSLKMLVGEENRLVTYHVTEIFMELHGMIVHW